MLIFYNVIQILGLIVFAPLLFVKIILTPKYRGRILKRLGIGLEKNANRNPWSRPRIWIHALSLGEVSSSKALVRELRKDFPQATIFFSAATGTGEKFARAVLEKDVDLFVPFPIDIFWSVRRVMRWVEPDVFVLVETDFWPNFLALLKQRNIPALLVNGRISEKSFTRYRRLRWIFLPLFASFRFISMQTEADAGKMVSLGVEADRVFSLGNLKYDSAVPGPVGRHEKIDWSNAGVPSERTILVAGSTHPGEEEIIFEVYKRLVRDFPDLFLAIAPRKVERSSEIVKCAESSGLSAFLRTRPVPKPCDVMVLDTLGELNAFYEICDIAFVGGSLVQEGGHNPLEPAVFGKPVVFGTSMDDFSEVSQGLLRAGGGAVVGGAEQLYDLLRDWLLDKSLRHSLGGKAQAFVQQHQGGAVRHVELVRRILQKERKE